MFGIYRSSIMLFMSQKERDVADTLTDMQAANDLSRVKHQHKQRETEEEALDMLKIMDAVTILAGPHGTREPEWRPPTSDELRKGIPKKFQVRVSHRKNGNPYRTYRSPTGTLYRSIVEVIRSLDDSSPSEDSDTSSSDGELSSEDESMCEYDDDIMQYTITLHIYVNDERQRDRAYRPMTTVGQVIDDVLPGGTLYYKGVGKSREERLQCVFEHLVRGGVYKVHLRNKPSIHTFVFNFNEH